MNAGDTQVICHSLEGAVCFLQQWDPSAFIPTVVLSSYLSDIQGNSTNAGDIYVWRVLLSGGIVSAFILTVVLGPPSSGLQINRVDAGDVQVRCVPSSGGVPSAFSLIAALLSLLY